MRLVLATADLMVEGRSFEGFPLLLADDGWPLEPAQSFLWHALVTQGSIESKLTWEAYGRRLCLGCPSYAIVGTVKDLHRLFSFQRFLMSEVGYYATDEWSEWRLHHQDLIARIDQIAYDNFIPEMVAQAKALAEKNPHSFWAIRMRQSQLSREARYGR